MVNKVGPIVGVVVTWLKKGYDKHVAWYFAYDLEDECIEMEKEEWDEMLEYELEEWDEGTKFVEFSYFEIKVWF